MKFKKVVGFGDSWIWGDELLDPALQDHPHAHPVLDANTSYREQNCFVGRIAKHYDVPSENFGIAGGSLQSTIWNYIWWLENSGDDPKECLVIVGLTSADRMSFYNSNHVSYPNDPPWHRYIHSAWVQPGGAYSKEWDNVVKNIMVLSQCNQLSKLNYLQSLMFFEGQNRLHKKILQFCTITPRWKVEAENMLWPDQGLTDFLISQPNYKTYLAPNGHPNELGHDLIAQRLISYIDSCIIKG